MLAQLASSLFQNQSRTNKTTSALIVCIVSLELSRSLSSHRWLYLSHAREVVWLIDSLMDWFIDWFIDWFDSLIHFHTLSLFFETIKIKMSLFVLLIFVYCSYRDRRQGAHPHSCVQSFLIDWLLFSLRPCSSPLFTIFLDVDLKIKVEVMISYFIFLCSKSKLLFTQPQTKAKG